LISFPCPKSVRAVSSFEVLDALCWYCRHTVGQMSRHRMIVLRFLLAHFVEVFHKLTPPSPGYSVDFFNWSSPYRRINVSKNEPAKSHTGSYCGAAPTNLLTGICVSWMISLIFCLALNVTFSITSAFWGSIS